MTKQTIIVRQSESISVWRTISEPSTNFETMTVDWTIVAIESTKAKAHRVSHELFAIRRRFGGPFPLLPCRVRRVSDEFAVRVLAILRGE